MTRRIACCAVLIALVVVFRPVSAAADPILSVTPSTATVGVGDTFTLDIVIEDVTDLASIGFDLLFDPAILQPASLEPAMEGDFLSSTGSSYFFQFYDPSFSAHSLSIGIALDAFSPGASAALGAPRLVASVSFLAVGAGVSAVAPDGLFLLDYTNAALLANGESYSPLPVIANEGMVTVTAPPTGSVPEPSTALLVAFGLAGLALRRRRVSRG